MSSQELRAFAGQQLDFLFDEKFYEFIFFSILKQSKSFKKKKKKPFPMETTFWQKIVISRQSKKVYVPNSISFSFYKQDMSYLEELFQNEWW